MFTEAQVVNDLNFGFRRAPRYTERVPPPGSYDAEPCVKLIEPGRESSMFLSRSYDEFQTPTVPKGSSQLD